MRAERLLRVAAAAIILGFGPGVAAEGGGPAASVPAASSPASATPLTLDSALALAHERSGSLRIKQLEIERSGYSVNEAFARGLPALSLTGSSTYMNNPPKGIKISQGAFGLAPAPGSQYPVAFPDLDYILLADTLPTYFKVDASLDQVLWTWGKIEKATELARLDVQLARVAVRADESALVRDVSKTYFGVVMARETLGPLREATTIMEGIIKDRKSSFGEGRATRQDLLEAGSKAAELAYQLVKAEQSLETGLDALEFYLGRRPSAGDLSGNFRKAPPSLDQRSLVESALRSSTDLESLTLKARQAALAKDIRAASLPGLPDFSLNVTWEVTGQKIPLYSSNWTNTWKNNLMVTLGGKVILFDSLASFWRLREAESQAGQADIGISELKRGMGIQVRKLVEAVQANAALSVQCAAAAELSAERARVARISRENELITRTEEGGAKIADISSRLALLLARFQTENALLDLEFASAGSLARP
ncbi:MAG: TolC family protein [Spirochaetota bacterium]